MPTPFGSRRNPHNIVSIPFPPKTSFPFSCTLWNARSVCNKFTSLHDLFIANSFNLLVITETWLHESDTVSPATLFHGGLPWTHSPRPGEGKRWGVGILLSPHNTFQVLYPPPSLHEISAVQISPPLIDPYPLVHSLLPSFNPAIIDEIDFFFPTPS